MGDLSDPVSPISLAPNGQWFTESPSLTRNLNLHKDFFPQGPFDAHIFRASNIMSCLNIRKPFPPGETISVLRQ